MDAVQIAQQEVISRHAERLTALEIRAEAIAKLEARVAELEAYTDIIKRHFTFVFIDADAEHPNEACEHPAVQ